MNDFQGARALKGPAMLLRGVVAASMAASCLGAAAQTVQPPLSWGDALFGSTVTSGAVTLPGGGSLSNKTITADGAVASVQCNGACSISTVRISSREGLRIGGSGNVNIDRSWIEATGISGDHADGIQAYSPGSTGIVTIKNSTIVAHDNNATAGLWSADNYTGTFVLENVIFKGGPYGLRIHPDVGGDNTISLKDVYFVGPFLYGPYLLSNYGGHVNRIVRWENVRWATIVNGALVPGSLIPCPDSSGCSSTTTSTTSTQISPPATLTVN